MFRILSFVLVLMIFCSTATAQKQKPVKDTAAFLRAAFKNAWGERIFSLNGKLVSTNHYTITAFTVKGCLLQATVKMKSRGPIGGWATYTLSYSIPLQDMYTIKQLADITKRNGEQYQNTGAQIEFRTGTSSEAIKYKMIEDLTGRIEANAGYNDATLWCDPKKSRQVLEVLNALLKSCSKPSN